MIKWLKEWFEWLAEWLTPKCFNCGHPMSVWYLDNDIFLDSPKYYCEKCDGHPMLTE